MPRNVTDSCEERICKHLPLPTAAKGSVIKEGVDSEAPSSSEPTDAGYVIDRKEIIDQEIEATGSKAAETE